MKCYCPSFEINTYRRFNVIFFGHYDLNQSVDRDITRTLVHLCQFVVIAMMNTEYILLLHFWLDKCFWKYIK